MKAAVLREVKKPLSIEDVQIDKPGPREVLMRTTAAGVCHSDVHRGPIGIKLGPARRLPNSEW